MNSQTGNRGSRQSVLSIPTISAKIAAAQSLGRTRAESLRFAESLGDRLGRGLDQGSIRPIAALHFLGVETTASCDGHDGRGYSFPWIDFAAPIENGEFLLEALPGWRIVQRGQGEARSYRLNPEGITSIEATSSLSRDYWQPARDQLASFANAVLQ